MPQRSNNAREWFEPLATLPREEGSDQSMSAMELSRCIAERINSRVGGRIRELRVSVEGDSVVLSGRCHTYHTKQLAQHAAQGVLENEALVNSIKVES